MKSRRRSQLSYANRIGIMINDDNCHKAAENAKVQEDKVIQQKKQIDNMLQQVVKQRMFGNLLAQQSRLSVEGYFTLMKICRSNINKNQLQLAKTLNPKGKKYFTIDNNQEILKTKRKLLSKKLIPSLQISPPKAFLQQIQGSKTLQTINRNSTILNRQCKNNLNLKNFRSNSMKLAPKTLQIDQKSFAQYFRKITLNQTQIIYDIKVTREQIINKYKSQISPFMLQRFLFFFNFPPIMTYRQYISNIQNAINCELKFVYFFVFGLLDESGNGFLTISDLFRFMKQFIDTNINVQSQIYLLAAKINNMYQNKQEKQAKRIEPTFEQVLLVNRNLKLDELKDLLKEGSKDRISVNCVKSTCYHQTILSLEHDPLERIKKYQIQETEAASKKQNKEKQSQTMLQDGIRFRDFAPIFMERRPKIFCLFIAVLANQRSNDYE